MDQSEPGHQSIVGGMPRTVGGDRKGECSPSACSSEPAAHSKMPWTMLGHDAAPMRALKPADARESPHGEADSSLPRCMEIDLRREE